MTEREGKVANPERTKVNEPEKKPETDTHETTQRHDDQPWPAVAKDVRRASDRRAVD